MHISAALGLARSIVIYYGQPWKTRALRRFYADIVKPGDLCFDIGAHVGSRSRIMLGCGATVVALEPQPLFLNFLRRTMRSTRLSILGNAVASEKGELTLRISSRHPTVTTLSKGWIDTVAPTSGFARVEWDEDLVVPVTTLDALIADYGIPAFCKIDVEGMEADILAGLNQPIGLVAVEYIPAAIDIALACIDRLEALGPYCFNRVEGEAHRFVGDEWLDADAMRQTLVSAAKNGRSGDLYARLSVEA